MNFVAVCFTGADVVTKTRRKWRFHQAATRWKPYVSRRRTNVRHSDRWSIKWLKSGNVNGRCRKKASKEIQDFLKQINLVPQLNLRGRTGAASLYYKANTNEGENIRYVDVTSDVTSEYPYVNSYGTYPMAHPEILLEPDDQDPASYYGILTVDILPS